MCVASDNARNIGTFFEDSDFVRDGAGPELGDPKPEIKDCGE